MDNDTIAGTAVASTGWGVLQAMHGERVTKRHGGDGLEDVRGFVCLTHDQLDDPCAQVRACDTALKDIVVGRATGFAQFEDRLEVRGYLQHPFLAQRLTYPQAAKRSLWA